MTDKAWGQLVSTTEVLSEPVLITKDIFVLGRGKDADLSFPGNNMVSGSHCRLERDSDGKVWIQDVSTNGTFINLSRKINKEKIVLNHGDEIHLVYRKKDGGSNIAFIFQDLEELRKEELDATLGYDTSETDIPSSEPDPLPSIATKAVEKRNADSEPEGKPAKKKSRKEISNEFVSCNAEIDSIDVPKDVSKDQENKTEDSKSEKKTTEKSPGNEKDELEETLMCIICQEILHDCISLQPCMHSFCAGCYSDWMKRSNLCPSCRDKVVRINKNHLVNNLVEAYLKTHPDKKRPDDELKELDDKNKITRDMLYPKREVGSGEDEEEDEDEGDAEVSIGDDYVDSSSSSSSDGGIAPAPYANLGQPIRPPQTVCRQCPSFRGLTTTVTPGPIPAVQNLATTDAQNVAAAVAALFSGSCVGTGGTELQPGTSAQHCQGEASTSGQGVVALTAAAGLAVPTPPPYICGPNQVHALCQCCLQPMPDRRADRLAYPNTIPPAQCRMCYGNFCHAYWGCQRAGCRGCLGRFRDMNFAPEVLDDLLLNNQYESEVLKNYMKLKKMTVTDLLRVCLDRMELGLYHAAVYTVNPGSVVCYKCGLQVFRDLAYQYRRGIPNKELPAGMTSRDDCYWGRTCRTQRKLHHAMRFNHICEKTMNLANW